MEVTFTAEEIAGLAVSMNNGTVPFMGLVSILPQGVENIYKWKPSFMFDKITASVKNKFKQMGILESYEFTNLTYTMLKFKCQISILEGDKYVKSMMLTDSNMAGVLKFNDDGTYTMTDGFDPKKLVSDFGKEANDSRYHVQLKEASGKPTQIDAEDIEEIFNLMHI